MSSYEPMRSSIVKVAPSEPAPAACGRPDLQAWSRRGGSLPAALATHMHDCAGCADHIRRMNEVFAALRLLTTQSAPPDLLARANGRALRMLRRAARASAAAQNLLRTRIRLSTWQRVQIHAARVSLSAAAALCMFLLRAGVLSGFEQTREVGEALSQLHRERHIDSTGEWMDPGHLT